jgi:hypothetical protein
MKRVLSILLMTLLFLGSAIFVAEPVALGQTVTRTRVVRYRRHKRTFWQKHRDKLTVAGTTATGAAIGALAGGKKGAGIGALAGGGGGALYTYKIRKRHRHRRY